MREYLSAKFLIPVLIIIDQVTKLTFSSRDFFMGNVHVHLVKNFGIGFGLNFGTLGNIAVLAIALAFFVYYCLRHNIPGFIFVLILAGGISNIIDRLYFGYVRDFLDLNLGFVFNLADVMIVVGLILLFLFSIPIADEQN